MAKPLSKKEVELFEWLVNDCGWSMWDAAEGVHKMRYMKNWYRIEIDTPSYVREKTSKGEDYGNRQ